MDFDHRKRVYMTGLMHCNQRVKQGIWIDRMIIGLILYSCFFLLLQASCCVGHGTRSCQPTAQYRSWVIHSWLLFFTGFGVRHCGRLASTRSWSSCFRRVGLMKSLQRRICFLLSHLFFFSRLGTIHGNIWTTFKRIERCSLQTSAALNLNITIQQSRCIFRLLKAVYR